MTSMTDKQREAFEAWLIDNMGQKVLAGDTMSMYEAMREAWCAANAARDAELRNALYPNGIKHPQQSEWDWIIERVRELAMRDAELEKIAKEMHYPACWDTMVYPTIFDALYEMAGCSECKAIREGV